MDRHVDPAFPAEESLVLRYHRGAGFEGLGREDYRQVSLGEGARILELLEHRGARVLVVDESTLMASGTFKSLEACCVMALCRRRGYRRVAFSSGANLGSALSLYGRAAGVETFFFHPATTSWKLDRAPFASPGAHLVAVDRPEREVKEAARLFARRAGVPHVPEMAWRFVATGLRALFVFESALRRGLRLDWASQAVCAGYGPIGFYDRAARLVREGAVPRALVPRFLGIQQEARAPMVRAWRGGHAALEPADVAAGEGDLLDPALYNTNPAESYPLLRAHLLEHGGALRALGREEYARHLPRVLAALAERGLRVKTRPVGGREEILEKAGIMALAGTLAAIDEGAIRAGETVLAFFTGGAGEYSGRAPEPERVIRRDEDLAAAVEDYARSVGRGDGAPAPARACALP